MVVVSAVLSALEFSFFMFWEILWPLALGFLLSAIVQAVVSQRAVVRVLGRPDFRGFAFACAFGAASSSCSYAAVALARSLFRKGADFTNAIIFEFASTNLDRARPRPSHPAGLAVPRRRARRRAADGADPLDPLQADPAQEDGRCRAAPG